MRRAVELPILHHDPASGIIAVTVGIDRLPLRLVAKIAIVHDLAREVQPPVALRIDLHIVILVVRLPEPDAREATEIIDRVLGEQVPAEPLVRVIHRRKRRLRL